MVATHMRSRAKPAGDVTASTASDPLPTAVTISASRDTPGQDLHRLPGLPEPPAREETAGLIAAAQVHNGLRVTGHPQLPPLTLPQQRLPRGCSAGCKRCRAQRVLQAAFVFLSANSVHCHLHRHSPTPQDGTLRTTHLNPMGPRHLK